MQAKDILDRILSGGELSVGATLRQPLVIPDAVSALDALERLRPDPLEVAPICASASDPHVIHGAPCTHPQAALRSSA